MKSLLAASLATLSVTGAYAAEVQAPAADYMPEATLDGLKGQTIPDTDPALQYPGSAYSMTKIQEGGDKPAGDNIVTKFTYDAQTQTMTPIYYRLDLKNTVYGEGDSERYFKYTDYNGKQVLEQTDKADEAAKKVGDMAGKAAAKTGDIAEKAAEKTGEMAQKAAEKINDAAEKVSDRLNEK